MSYTAKDLLPHREPFLFTDRVMYDGTTDTRHFQTSFTPRSDSLFYDAELGGMPAYVGIEIMAQAIGSYVGYCDRLAGLPPVESGKLLSVRGFLPSVAAFKEGEELTISIRRDLFENNIGSFYACITAGGETLAEAEMTLYRESPL